ncbi:nucleotidyltransferase domain-containing protein [Streptomyces sp. NPDC001674]|uniref:nucleotidyltransferase domain-containing protein n=1 Tax=Streptomyces sp. NPDC001674 TaxID=3154394 RepID=UPI00332516F0
MDQLAPSRDRLTGTGRKVAGLYTNVATAYVCGSLVEGFGNSQSDLDVFVLTDGPSRRREDEGTSATFTGDEYRIDIDFADEVRVDTECWDIAQVRDVARRINNCSVGDWTAPAHLESQWFQLAHGIRIGWAVREESVFEELRTSFDWGHVSHLLYCRYMLSYTGASEDTVGAISAGDAGTAMLNSRQALGFATDALLAAAGSTNIKPKWRFAKLRQLGMTEEFERYFAAEAGGQGTDDDVLLASKDRLRLASDFTLAAAALVGRL